jgi:hypothetical protein
MLRKEGRKNILFKNSVDTTGSIFVVVVVIVDDSINKKNILFEN